MTGWQIEVIWTELSEDGRRLNFGLTETYPSEQEARQRLKAWQSGRVRPNSDPADLEAFGPFRH